MQQLNQHEQRHFPGPERDRAQFQRVTSREVLFVTPVLHGQQIPPNLGPRKVTYRSGFSITDDPEHTSNGQMAAPGIVIDLPLTNIAAYSREFLPWLPLRTDSALVDFIHKTLKGHHGSNTLEHMKISEVDLRVTPLFEEADQET